MFWLAAETMASTISLPTQAWAAGMSAESGVRPKASRASFLPAFQTKRKASGVLRRERLKSSHWLASDPFFRFGSLGIGGNNGFPFDKGDWSAIRRLSGAYPG